VVLALSFKVVKHLTEKKKENDVLVSVYKIKLKEEVGHTMTLVSADPSFPEDYPVGEEIDVIVHPSAQTKLSTEEKTDEKEEK